MINRFLQEFLEENFNENSSFTHRMFYSRGVGCQNKHGKNLKNGKVMTKYHALRLKNIIYHLTIKTRLIITSYVGSAVFSLFIRIG